MLPWPCFLYDLLYPQAMAVACFFSRVRYLVFARRRCQFTLSLSLPPLPSPPAPLTLVLVQLVLPFIGLGCIQQTVFVADELMLAGENRSTNHLRGPTVQLDSIRCRGSVYRDLCRRGTRPKRVFLSFFKHSRRCRIPPSSA